MTRRGRRLVFVILGMLVLGGATALVLTAFQESLVFFYSPSDIATKPLTPDRRVRIGGVVAPGSLARDADGLTVRFTVTDFANSVPVTYRGVLPDLFREGQGVVAEGRLAGGVFQADEVLAKHDEKYMPPEVVDALKKAGRWQEGVTK